MNTSMIQCPQCKKQVPADTVKCPYCGYQFNQEPPRVDNEVESLLDEKGLQWYMWILLLVTAPLVPFIYWIVMKNKHPVKGKQAGWIAFVVFVLYLLLRILS